MDYIAQAGVGPNEMLSLTILVTFLAAAVLCDLHSRCIPNVLVSLMLAVGLGTQAFTAPGFGIGLLAGLCGGGVGLLILLPFYALRGMGAGDVKLFAATGSFLGVHGTLLAGFYTLVVGAVLGLIVMAYRISRESAWARIPADLARANGEPAQLPYSVAISVGVLMAVVAW